MSKKKIIFAVLGVMGVAGAFAAVSAQGRRGGDMDDGMGHGWHGGPMQRFADRFRGGVTKDEFDARTRERFARLDKNGDGVIDAAELEAAFMAGMPGGGAADGKQGPRPFDRMIRRFDANKDGKATKDEFIAEVKRLFAEADLNNDGRLADDDLPPMMRGRNALSGGGMMMSAGMGHRGMGPGGMGGPMGPLMHLIRDADANKDGVITLDEAVAAAEKHIAMMDRNKDGAIDSADFAAMRKDMVDYRVKRFIHQFGADKEGKVTREQFTKKAAERFALMDLDSDGKLARDEMPGGGHGRRGHHGGPHHGGMGGSMHGPMQGMGGGEDGMMPGMGMAPGQGKGPGPRN